MIWAATGIHEYAVGLATRCRSQSGLFSIEEEVPDIKGLYNGSLDRARPIPSAAFPQKKWLLARRRDSRGIQLIEFRRRVAFDYCAAYYAR